MTTILKHTALIVAALLACAAAPAMAQASKQSNFTGPALGVAISAQQNRVDFDPAASSEMKASSSGVDLLGSYGFAMGPQWVGTVGLSLGLKNSDFGSMVIGSTTSTATAKNHLSVSFAPGYRVGNDGLVYGKLAFHTLSANYTSSSGFDETKTHSGTGFGVGYAMALSSNLELRGELESVTYSSETTGTTSKSIPKQTNFTVGLLYKF